MEELASFTCLADHRYIALTTYRKSGDPVMTPVWFVLQDEKLFVWTSSDSGKAKRLRRNPRVQLAPSNHSGKQLGAVETGAARFVPSRESAALDRAFRAKYGWQRALFALIWKIGGRQDTYIEISFA